MDIGDRYISNRGSSVWEIDWIHHKSHDRPIGLRKDPDRGWACDYRWVSLETLKRYYTKKGI